MNSGFRFFHCSDLLLDAPFPCAADGTRRRLSEAAREAFRCLVDQCLEEKVDALLIAGNLFDEDRLTLSTEAFLYEQLERLTGSGVTVVACSGSADPGHEGGRGAVMRWPQHRLHLLRSPDPEEVLVRDADGQPVGRVIGCGRTSRKERKDPIAPLPQPSGPEPAVGLLHAGAAADGKSGFRTQDLADKGYRYWALGGSGRRSQVAERPAAYDAGPLVSHGFSQDGPLGALLVSVPATGEPEVSFRALSSMRWETLPLDRLEDVADRAALASRADQAISDLCEKGEPLPGGRGDPQWLVRVSLSGPCPAAGEASDAQDLADLADSLATAPDVLHVEVVADALTGVVDVAEHAGQPHLLGIALDLIDKAQRDDELMARLMPAKLAGCSTRDARGRARYLRELLPGLDREAVEALLQKASS